MKVILKEDIKKFIDNQKIFLEKTQTEINTHNTYVQELSEMLKHLDCWELKNFCAY